MKNSCSQSQNEAPTLRLSKFKAKAKVIPKSSDPQRNVKKRKRRKSYCRHSNRIPIPSFSPVASPVRKHPLIKLAETPSPTKHITPSQRLSAILENDDDDEDDLLPSPVFKKRQRSPKKKAIAEADINKKNCKEDEGKSLKVPKESPAEEPANKGVKRTEQPKQDLIVLLEEEEIRTKNKENNGLENQPNQIAQPKKLKVSNNNEACGKDEARDETCAQTDELSHLAAAAPSPKTNHPAQPTPNTLAESVDFLFGNVDDQDSVTVRDVVSGLEDIFGVPLTKATKVLVKNRLRDLVHGKVEPFDALSQETKGSGDMGDISSLLASVDRLYAGADKDTVTVRDIGRALEAERGETLSASLKKTVTDHLRGLVQKNRAETKVSEQVKERVKRKSGSSGNDATQTAEPGVGEVSKGAKKHTKYKADSVQSKSNKGSEKPKAPAKTTASSKNTVDLADTEQEISISNGAEKNDPSAKESKGQNATRKKRGRPRKAKPVESGNGTESNVAGNSNTANVARPTRAAPQRKRAKKGTCALCTTCSCSNGSKKLDTADSISMADFSKTDAQVERALFRRLQKLEKTTNWYEDLTDQVRREYKKHQRILIKKQQEKLGVNKDLAFGSSRFLPDSHEWDAHLQSTFAPPVVETQVQKAQGSLFAGKANFQPTLTQMLRGDGGEKASEVADDQDGECANTTIELDEEGDCNDTNVNEEAHFEDNHTPEEVKEDGIDPVEAMEVTDEENSIPVDRIHRLSWRQGERIASDEGTPAHGSGLWTALTAGHKTAEESVAISKDNSNAIAATPCAKSDSGHSISMAGENAHMKRYDSLWDRMFDDDIASNDGGGLDDLLSMFQSSPTPDGGVVDQVSSQCALDSPSKPFVDNSMLTPRRLAIAEQIEKKIQFDADKHQAVEKACPNWKENIRFGLVQGDEGDVKAALEKVKNSKRRLAEAKQKILESIQRQEAVLELFQTTLDSSLENLACTGVRDDEDSYCSNIEMMNSPRVKESAVAEFVTVASN